MTVEEMRLAVRRRGEPFSCHSHTAEFPMPKKEYAYPPARVDRAVDLQKRVADDQASPAEIAEYRRVINILRAKFLAGSLSKESARLLGFE